MKEIFKKTEKFWAFGMLLFCWLLASSTSAWGWGPKGHRITAEIAQLHLSPKAQAILQREFNIERLEKVSNWADQIKGKRKNTKPWHYTNIPAGLLVYDRSRDCPKGNCVTEKIKQFKRLLAERGHSQGERAEALMFLVHFVADIHQPLHLGNRRDRGGNEIEFPHEGRPTNLHALWDHGLIAHPGKSLLEYAADLDHDILKGEVADWVATDVEAWAEESRKLALSKGYPLRLNATGEPSKAYLVEGEKVVAFQLQKGGVRLAHLLNQLFK